MRRSKEADQTYNHKYYHARMQDPEFAAKRAVLARAKYHEKKLARDRTLAKDPVKTVLACQSHFGTEATVDYVLDNYRILEKK